MATINNYKSVNTWSKGMNKDLDISVLPKESYLHAENYRLVTNTDSSTTSLEVVDGNTIQLSSSLPSGAYILSHCIIRDILVLFVIYNGCSYIYRSTITNGIIGTLTTVYDDSMSPDGTRFNFSVNYPIRALGRYESDDIIKVYWTDNYNRLRFINIADTNNQTYSVNRFDILPSYTESPITISNIGSGALKSGMVQYSYQLYNTYGSETAFSPPTSLLPLSSSTTTGTDILFVGDKENENSGKSVTFSISNIDIRFNRIRVVRLLHTNLLELPKINIIAELPVETSIIIVDNGNENLGEITPEEFNFINYDFICKEIETKNNILFAANIQENIWDVEYDARAYRFGPNGGATLYAADGVSDPIDITDTNLKSGVVIIPETHDCYNIYNDWTQDNLNREGYKYKGDATTIGGEGINISYSFSNSSNVFTLDSNTSSVVINTNHATGNVDPIYVSDNIGYQADEIYPFAIVLLNTKGQRSYPKWIGDIRFPRRTDGFTNLMAYGVAGYNMYISFTVSNLPTDCVGFQIVRCERTASDRTILAQGLIGATRVYDGDTTFNCPPTTLSTVRQYLAGETLYPYQQSKTLNKQVLEFISPEIVYNKNMKYSGGDMLEIVGIVTNNHKFVKTDNDTNPFVDNLNFNYRLNRCLVVNKCNDVSNIILGNIRRTSVTDFKIVDSPDDRPINETIASYYVTIGTSNYENYVRNLKIQMGVDAYKVSGKHGTTGILSTNANLDLSSIIDTSYTYGNKYVLCNYKRAVTPYGGASYEARTRRTYIPCSDIYTSEGTYKIKRGDTFVTKFEYQRVMSVGLFGQLRGDETLVEVIQFPVETSINTRWQSNNTFTQLYANSSNIPINTNAAIIQEKAGLYKKDNREDTSEWINVVFNQSDNLYSYNSVYSKQNTIKKFYPKQLDINENQRFDSRIIASDTKINGELADSWVKFRLNEFIDVDSKYGPINTLYTHNDNLLFWQSKGFGVASVNQRSLLQDNNPGSLVVGTGGILTRYDYISNNVGNISQFGVIHGGSGLYWFDTLNSSFYKYNGQGVDPISKIKGLQSYINLSTNKTTQCIGTYDNKYTECIFTLNTNGTKTTIAFNELIDAFTSFYGFTTDWYIRAFDGSYYTLDSTRNYPYLHNSGNKATFYGTLYPSIIKLLVNDNYSETKVFDSLEYKSRSYSGTGNIFNDTFNTMKIYTEKQYTGEVTLDNTNTTKREGNFSTIISRNIVNSDIINTLDIFNPTNHNTSRLFKERIRDKYCVIELKYNNTNNYRFNVPFVITNYRISYR